SRDDVVYIAELAKLRLSESEIEAFTEQLSAILDYAQALSALDTEAIPPTASVIPQQSLLAEDVPHNSLDREILLRNAPDAEAGQFRVKAILD
ncbi:MAG: Asp-tRNA(Asn)/Glu-tRNA(Gln) amidotransferase GatCAB subunit C, partial [Phototrophicales bacterium]